MNSKEFDNIKIKDFDSKINKRYGIPKEELKDLSLSKIKSLRNINKNALKEAKNFKVIRGLSNTIIKGASLGAGISGTINTMFPNIVPVIASALTTNSDLNNFGKGISYILAASKPVDVISGYSIIGIGAGIGAIVYSGYTLIKSGSQKIIDINNRNKSKKLCK